MTNQPQATSPLLRISEAAKYLKVSQSTVYRMLRDVELTPLKLRGCTRIVGSDLAELIERVRTDNN